MPRARKKPVEVNFCVWEGDFIENGMNIAPNWINNALSSDVLFFQGQGELYIRTLEGDHHCSVGDVIIEGVNGELYPCKPDIFAKTYEVINHV